jgi:hypothetical protein
MCADHMDYAANAAQGVPIGSGSVESLCSQPLKRTGQYLDQEGLRRPSPHHRPPFQPRDRLPLAGFRRLTQVSKMGMRLSRCSAMDSLVLPHAPDNRRGRARFASPHTLLPGQRPPLDLVESLGSEGQFQFACPPPFRSGPWRTAAPPSVRHTHRAGTPHAEFSLRLRAARGSERGHGVAVQACVWTRSTVNRSPSAGRSPGMCVWMCV